MVYILLDPAPFGTKVPDQIGKSATLTDTTTTSLYNSCDTRRNVCNTNNIHHVM